MSFEPPPSPRVGIGTLQTRLDSCKGKSEEEIARNQETKEAPRRTNEPPWHIRMAEMRDALQPTEKPASEG